MHRITRQLIKRGSSPAKKVRRDSDPVPHTTSQAPHKYGHLSLMDVVSQGGRGQISLKCGVTRVTRVTKTTKLLILLENIRVTPA
ncbi:hypothetical protein EMIT0373P_30821 [Pseudomonas chlororaphis]